MINDTDSQEIEQQPTEDEAVTQKAPVVEGEFRVTVRKLERSVKPRGVLAE